MLYFVFGLRSSVKNLLWQGLLLATWISAFSHQTDTTTFVPIVTKVQVARVPSFHIPCSSKASEILKSRSQSNLLEKRLFCMTDPFREAMICMCSVSYFQIISFYQMNYIQEGPIDLQYIQACCEFSHNHVQNRHVATK